MTTYLDDLFDIKDFIDARDAGYVKVQRHPSSPLVIANYTAKAQYDNVWTPVTKQCRGLIYSVDTEDGRLRVVSRPFPKFFNVGQLRDDEIPFEPFRVFEKMDGSLGVLYTPDDGETWAIATRGSFTSDQAKFATEFLQVWLDRFYPDPELTYLFEIIYPDNRIVVDYGGLSTIVLLDVIETDTGKSVMDEVQYDHRAWPGRQVSEWDGFDALEDLLKYDEETPHVTDREGFVIRFESDLRVKVKLDEYVRLHRILTNVSTRDVYRMLAVQSMLHEGIDHKRIAWALGMPAEDVAGTPTLDTIVEKVPDEFHDWLQNRVADYTQDYTALLSKVTADYVQIREVELLGVDTRPAFAARVRTHPYNSMLFGLYDGRSISALVWKANFPPYGKPFWNTNEDVA